MHVFQPVTPREIDQGPFIYDGSRMLITAGKEGKVNTAATGFGGYGYLWGKRVVYIFLRSKRYTRELLDETGEFSISFLNQTDFKRELKYISMVSGRDEDKIAGARLTVNHSGDIPFIDEADNVITARVLFHTECEPEGFADPELKSELGDDNYIMYVGEIQKILIR
ncbi:MAG: flavin reductase [Butyrivibrio sp.]|nr:flavin reductase [Butyrivibrio sp.]